MGEFEPAWAYLMVDEGGGKIVDNPHDAGGTTKWGISLKFLRDYYQNQNLTRDAIVELSEDDAKAIALGAFWRACACNLSESQAIATAMFDQAFLEGSGSSALHAQFALIKLGEKLKVDGILGPETWGLINKHGPKVFLPEFVGLLCQRYETLATMKPENSVFLKGWTNRAQRLLTLC